MKLFIEKEKLNESPENFLRSEGYGYLQARGDKQDSFARRLARGAFPRLHMYVNDRGTKWEFHLHMDQKAASYQGTAAHSGEYEGPIVAEEINRLANSLGVSPSNNFNQGAVNKQTTSQPRADERQNVRTQKAVSKKGSSAEDKLGHGSLGDIKIGNKKTPFWKKKIF